MPIFMAAEKAAVAHQVHHRFGRHKDPCGGPYMVPCGVVVVVVAEEGVAVPALPSWDCVGAVVQLLGRCSRHGESPLFGNYGPLCSVQTCASNDRATAEVQSLSETPPTD